MQRMTKVLIILVFASLALWACDDPTTGCLGDFAGSSLVEVK